MKTKLVLTLIMTAMVVTVLLSAPRTAAAFCKCLGGDETGDYWGMGSSCSAAEADARGQALAAAQASCAPDGACNTNFVSNNDCYWEPVWEVYKASGHETYKCYICF